MEIEIIKNSTSDGFSTSTLINQVLTGYQKKVVDRTFEVVEPFMEIFRTEASKLPYHINLLDEIRVNENDHTKILAKLLHQKEGETYEILSSFYQYLSNHKVSPTRKSSFKMPDQTRPDEITVEKGRIDLLIRGKNFAIIIENKIHDAPDQDSQIARYINQVREFGFADSDIYVIYLTRDFNKKIKGYSWLSNGENLKKKFSNRFYHLTYKNDILPWLKNYVLPLCRVKDIYLKSAVEQYIDHIEEIFKQRKIDQAMNQELQNHLKQALKLDEINTFESRREIISKKIEEIDIAKEQLDKLLANEFEQQFIRWENCLKNDFPEYGIVGDYGEEVQFKNIGIKMNFGRYEFSVLLEYEETHEEIYYGIECYYSVKSRKHKLIENELIPKLKNGFIVDDEPSWYMWKYTTFSSGYQDLKKLIEDVQKETKIYNQLKN